MFLGREGGNVEQQQIWAEEKTETHKKTYHVKRVVQHIVQNYDHLWENGFVFKKCFSLVTYPNSFIYCLILFGHYKVRPKLQWKKRTEKKGELQASNKDGKVFKGETANDLRQLVDIGSIGHAV